MTVKKVVKRKRAPYVPKSHRSTAELERQADERVERDTERGVNLKNLNELKDKIMRGDCNPSAVKKQTDALISLSKAHTVLDNLVARSDVEREITEAGNGLTSLLEQVPSIVAVRCGGMEHKEMVIEVEKIMRVAMDGWAKFVKRCGAKA